VTEDDIAGLVDVLVEVQRPAGFAQQLGELALALLEGRAAQVFAAERLSY
jgi:hypothetical protein